MEKSNIVLIGMPGSGKSTVGVILAKKLIRSFLDTDVLIQTTENRSLQQIIDSEGYLSLRMIEEKCILTINCADHVIATGGSAVYSEPAILHLKKNGVVVFLNVTLESLYSRINDFDTRGLAIRADQTFEDLYYERLDLYKKYADVTIHNSYKSQDAVCEEIISACSKIEF